MKRPVAYIVLIWILGMGFLSCREDEHIIVAEYQRIPDPVDPNSRIAGMYLVNEGNMGSNKCTLDYLDFTTSVYMRNIYPERNPTVVKELGDVGNDVQIYGEKLYVVVNCSHKMEVLDARTGIRLTQIDIPNCRYVRFYRGQAYVSSYVAGVLIDPNAPLGAVYKVDTTTLKIIDKVTVGYQPEEMEVLGEYLYVANSGGYRVPYYDNTVSVVELERFKQVRKIPVGLNLHRIRKDDYGRLWVSSRGNYNDIYSPYGSVSSNLFVLEKKMGYNDMVVTDTIGIPCSNMAIHGDSLFLYSHEYDNQGGESMLTYAIINVRTKEVVSKNFITDGTESEIKMPYGIAVHPETGAIYVSDAKNYVSTGTLSCYDKNGKRQWRVQTGDIPAHMAFLKKINECGTLVFLY
ncbi:MAG: YncE family protein [Massilibacteroides sp.]|nr:YncE family protein [Massilibacteroides sp.]MDD3063748.1 YncE family protein [Massilibacteroides sp.]MDD4114752.1 YncE family protein [Massilibacteroides sp.]MDD4659900.1 YncE family protein [Massilibacteroides sp.]